MSKGSKQFTLDQEIFETDDVPEEDVCFEDDSKSGTVDVLDASMRSSYNKFKGKSVDATATDFSRLGRPQQCGYKVEPEDMEMISVCREPETLMQRYHRLKQEVTELISDVQKIKNDHTAAERLLGVPLTDVAEDVQQLQKQLLSLQMDQPLSVPLLSSTQQSFQSVLLRDLKVQLEALNPQAVASPQQTDSLLYEVYTRTETGKFANLSKMSELEQRLGLLEGLVGKNTSVSTVAGGLDAEHKDVSSAVLNLQAKVALLDLPHVEAISSQVQRLITLVDDAQTKTKSKLDDKKVSDALQTVTRLWTVAPMVPELVARLHTLKELHERAAQFAGSVSYMATAQDEMEKQITNLQGLLNQVQGSLQENLSTIQVNLASLESRINALK